MITKITTPELFNLQSNNTEGTQLPVMTRAERIAMTGMSNGELIFNSTTDSVEYYDAGAAAWYKIDYAPPPLYPPFTLKFTVGSVNTRSVSSYIRHTTIGNQGTAFYKGGTQSAAATSTTKGNVNSGTYSNFTGTQQGLLYHQQAWNGTGTQILGGSSFGNNIYAWQIADWDDRVIENGTLISTFYNHKNITVDREGKTALMVDGSYTSWKVFSFATPQDFTSAITLEASYTASNNSNLYTSSNTSGTGHIQFLGDNGLYIAFGFVTTGQYKIYSINPSNPYSLNSSDHTLQGTITFTTSLPSYYMSIDPSMDAIAWGGPGTGSNATYKSVPLT